MSSLSDDLEEIRRCYHSERSRLLRWQGQKVDDALDRVKCRAGYSTLTSEDAQRVIQPLQQASTETDADAVAPVLVQLKDPFELKLRRAEEQANERLDEILSRGDKPLIKPFELKLKNRELTTEAEVEALVEEIKQPLLEEVRAGARLRLL